MTTNEFHNLEEIHAYLDAVSDKYKDLATVGSIGKSHEGRDMKYVKLGKPGKENKKAAFIHGMFLVIRL